MKNLKIAVCDDDKMILQVIENTIKGVFEQRGKAVTTQKFSDLRELARLMPHEDFDLLFLDIDMAGKSPDGIEFGKALRERKYAVEIIYISNREDRVFDSFAVHPFGFIRKNSFLTDISNVIEAYLKYIDNSDVGGTLVLTTDKGRLSLSYNEVVYIECLGKGQYIRIKDREEKVMIRATMDKLAADLEPYGFVRTHKSYIVNCRYIRVIDKNEVSLTTGDVALVSRSRVHELRETYLKYLASHGSNTFF